MERNSGKRVAAAPKRGCSPRPPNKVQDLPFCNRIGCSGRMKYSQNQNMEIGTSNKLKSPKTSNEISSRPKRLSIDLMGKVPSRSESSISTEESSQSKSQEITSPSSSRKLARHRLGLNSGLPSTITSRKMLPELLPNSGTYGLRSQNNSSSSSSSFSTSTSSNMYGLRSLKFNSISNNALPSSSSKPASKNIRKKNLPDDRRQKTLVSGISINASGRSNSASGDGNKNTGSVRTRRPTNGRNVGSNSSDPELRPQFSASSPLGSSSPLSSNPVADFTCFGRYNMNGLAEILFALDRIRHEELTHEQELDLESNLFISELSLSDQYRDMRLDIDNMSYEELLALEEQMGSVCTALSDEMLSKCIKKGIYDAGQPKVRVMGSVDNGDEIKCSICQEEYALGDETGELVECQHEYHLTCINEWLRLKNWCPICKASVAGAIKGSGD